MKTQARPFQLEIKQRGKKIAGPKTPIWTEAPMTGKHPAVADHHQLPPAEPAAPQNQQKSSSIARILPDLSSQPETAGGDPSVRRRRNG